MKQLIGIVIIALSFSTCWAEVSPMAHLRGIGNQLRDLRAKLATAHLSERHRLLEEIAKTELWLKAQQTLLGIDTEEQPLSPPEFLEPTPSYPWLPESPQAVAAQLDDIPLQKTYVFNFGRSQRELRQLKNKETLNNNGVDSLSLGDNESRHGTADHRRQSDHKPYPAEICKTPPEDLAKLPMVISSSDLNIPVPRHYRDGSWWLYEKQGKRPWVKRRFGSGDRNIKLTQLAQGPFMYTFTRPERRPGIGKPHYHFWLDTQAPLITTWSSQKKPNGLWELSWETQDPPLGKLLVTVTVYKSDQSVLSTLGGLEPKGITLLPPHLFASAARAEVKAQDQAGNLSKRELVF